MDTVIKSFVGTFFILLLTALGLSILQAGTMSRSADRYADSVKSRIECSGFSPRVIADCVDEAEEKGYLLKVTVSPKGGDGRQYGHMSLYYNAPVAFLAGTDPGNTDEEAYSEVIRMDLI